MAGFRLPVVPATIQITDGPYAGVEVAIDAGLSPLARFTLVGLMQQPADETVEERATRSKELLRLLAETVILGWNVEDRKGVPIPVTIEGLASVPPILTAQIIVHILATKG